MNAPVTSMLRMFTFEITGERRDIQKGEEGYLPGHSPDTAPWTAMDTQMHVVSSYEDLARRWVNMQYRDVSLYRNLAIRMIRTTLVNAVISVSV